MFIGRSSRPEVIEGRRREWRSAKERQAEVTLGAAKKTIEEEGSVGNRRSSADQQEDNLMKKWKNTARKRSLADRLDEVESFHRQH